MNGALMLMLPSAAAALLAGLLFGLVYFAMLGRSVALFLHGAGALLAVGMTLMRLAAAAAAFALAARFGAPALLGALLGFLAARFVALRLHRSPR